MKTIQALVVLLLFVGMPGVGEAKRAAPLTEEERTIVQVYEAPTFTKDELFTASRMWIAQNFKSAKSVIEYENKDDGTLIGKGSIAYPCTGGWTCRIRSESWRVTFTMRLEAKDGRFRLTFTNVMMSYPTYSNMGVTRSAYDEPVASREDMDNIKAKLLEFGDQIVASVGQLQSDDNW